MGFHGTESWQPWLVSCLTGQLSSQPSSKNTIAGRFFFSRKALTTKGNCHALAVVIVEGSRPGLRVNKVILVIMCHYGHMCGTFN